MAVMLTMLLRIDASRRMFCILVLSISLAIGAPAPLIADPVQEDMARANALMESGQYLEAVAAYQMIADHADNVEIRAKAILQIGDAYGFFLNNYDLALNKYWLIKRDYPQTPQAESAYFNSGMIYYERRQYKEALQQFRIYLKNYPKGSRRETATFMLKACTKPTPLKDTPTVARKTTQADENGKRDLAGIIRVIIAANVPDIRLRAESPFVITGSREKDPGKEYREAVVRASNGTLSINDEQTDVNEIVIRTTGNCRLVTVNGKPYRGSFKIFTVNRNSLHVINTLDIESYLYGVIPKEMSPQWPLEALKAQSVAARSFALYQKRINKNRAYDVAASTGSQVYGGYSVESPPANRAVDETKGIVMMHKGQPALAYFHANSGGITEEASNVWTAEVPYLKSVEDAPSTRAPNMAWSASLDVNTIKRSLLRHGIKLSAVTGIRAVKNSPSGRVTKIGIYTPEGEIVLDGNDFRLKVDPSIIKSTLFNILPRDDGEENVRFEGRGFGHGVGMSQWGALVMAREGCSYREILSHYYRGVEILKQ
jgi:stage II sporulation protein D